MKLKHPCILFILVAVATNAIAVDDAMLQVADPNGVIIKVIDMSGRVADLPPLVGAGVEPSDRIDADVASIEPLGSALQLKDSDAERTANEMSGLGATLLGEWGTFQGNIKHNGYIPISLDHEAFSLRWQQDVGEGTELYPVAAADGKVFVSKYSRFNDTTQLFVLDAQDGEALWSRGFGPVSSVGHPSYSYGTVYIQTGKPTSGGQQPYLHAFDADTGDVIFQSNIAAQWDNYYAPTIDDGVVYINGGSYGGMYAFDAFSGAQLWFLSLPQYDEWTPALDDEYAYAYLGEYTPGLYAVNRGSGAQAFMIPDPNFDWNGWSMRLAPVVGNHDNVLAIHSGRLISFDTENHSIRWELSGDFEGQPSVAKGLIYAIQSGHLAVLDEQTGAFLWSWVPPEGTLRGAMIVTDTYLFAVTAGNVYAVDLLMRDDMWSFTVSGHLSLGNDMLYVASNSGMLTAFSLPEFIPARLDRIEIVGPSEVVEYSTAEYSAVAHYDDGRIRDRTFPATWALEPDISADISENGLLTVGELLEPLHRVDVRATYMEGDITAEATLSVDLVIGVSIGEFIERNIVGAIEIQLLALQMLNEAQFREGASLEVIDTSIGTHEGDRRAFQSVKRLQNALFHSVFWTDWGHTSVERSLDHLEKALDHLPREETQAQSRQKTR